MVAQSSQASVTGRADGRRRSPQARPSLRRERGCLRAGAAIVVGMDEVGRGALAGPVAVGAVAVTEKSGRPPVGVKDSKQLTPVARERLVQPIHRWAFAVSVGMASAGEIDEVGITAALGLAGFRALQALARPSIDVVLLDGNVDWLSPAIPFQGQVQVAEVHPIIAGDRSSTATAAASILAKVSRDALMVAAHEDYPHYGWQHNKGYAAEVHQAGLASHGACPLHRVSWRLPTGQGTAIEPQEVSSGHSSGSWRRL